MEWLILLLYQPFLAKMQHNIYADIFYTVPVRNSIVPVMQVKLWNFLRRSDTSLSRGKANLRPNESLLVLNFFIETYCFICMQWQQKVKKLKKRAS